MHQSTVSDGSCVIFKNDDNKSKKGWTKSRNKTICWVYNRTIILTTQYLVLFFATRDSELKYLWLIVGQKQAAASMSYCPVCLCQPLFFHFLCVFFIIESWIFILQRISTLFLLACSCLILVFWPPSHQHLIGAHNESSSEQLPNVSSTIGISLRSFICLIYHEITREWASASHNVACQQIIQLCLSIWKRGCVYKKDPLSLSRIMDLTTTFGSGQGYV